MADLERNDPELDLLRQAWAELEAPAWGDERDERAEFDEFAAAPDPILADLRAAYRDVTPRRAFVPRPVAPRPLVPRWAPQRLGRWLTYCVRGAALLTATIGASWLLTVADRPGIDAPFDPLPVRRAHAEPRPVTRVLRTDATGTEIVHGPVRLILLPAPIEPPTDETPPDETPPDETTADEPVTTDGATTDSPSTDSRDDPNR